MNVPAEERAAARKSLAEHPSVDDPAERRRQYVAANRDRIRELSRLWRSEHLDPGAQSGFDASGRGSPAS